MATLPDRIQKSIGENQTIVFWCRRSSYEVIHELGVGVGGAITWSAFVLTLYNWFDWDRILILLLVSLFGVWYFIWEWLKWSNEYHVITEYIYQNGGNYTRFSGVLKYDDKTIPVHAQGPVVDVETPLEAWLWEKATGINLGRIELTDQSREVIKNTMMPKAFKYAINNVKGSPPQEKLEDDPTVVSISRELRNVITSGVLPKWEGQRFLRNEWRQRYDEFN